MYDIVVARYNESINWVDWLTPEQRTRVKVYNKGPDDLSYPVTEKLPNIGREGHTYLWYIIQNYDRLPDYVIFIQADPFDHFNFEPKDMSDVVREWIREVKWNGITKGVTSHEYEHDISRDSRFGYYKGNLYPSSRNFGEWMDEFVEQGVCPPKRMHACGCFGVSSKLIKTRSVDYYKKILDDLSVDNNPESGHYLERSWHYIFNGHRHISLITKVEGVLIILIGILIWWCVKNIDSK
jgi:hypothetical protein